MLERLHLIRHGEVANPDAVVYAALPGFGLSPLGRAQAGQAARRLASSRVGLVVSSPLDRAVATAEPIAAGLAVPLRVDDRLIEWRLADRWAGVAWADLPERFPGEVEAYLATPADLPFSAESIQEVARRMAEVVTDLDREDLAEAVVVSHQDPVQALRFVLTGRDLASLGYDQPGHATMVTLRRAGAGWTEEAIWSPPVTSPAFPPIAGGDAT
ncbi:MAG: hypothetical protein A2Z12_08330 [Actinobacteria bacterium RBG_16_68_21]|nr:MAG: hypothetical protein A2Z12_08330 [Actinobacteria bacterium RBG_16_68_21]